MSKGKDWTRWVMQTARSWEDITHIIEKTGIESIDNDHRQMTEVVLEINNLIDLYDTGGMKLTNIEEQGRVLDTLHRYAMRHFEREIFIIKKYDLPGLDIQLQQHAQFMGMLERAIQDFEEGRIAVSLNLKASVLEWWVNHINTIDANTFSRENWTRVAIGEARCWDDVSEIIRRMGIDLLDREHKQLTETALELIQHAEAGDVDMEVIEDIFTRLRSIALRHFGHEEEFIYRYELPDLEKQNADHATFMKLIDDSQADFKAGKLSIQELQEALLQWWVNHINLTDYNVFSMDKWGHILLGNSETWAEALEFIHHTGVEVVDDDHKAITQHILAIDDLIALSASASPEEIKQHGHAYFDEMHGLCVAHFAHEEKTMQAALYSGFKLHKEQHNRFLVSLERHRDDFSSGRSVASKHMKNFILKWWVEHIKEFDLRAFSGHSETGSDWDALVLTDGWDEEEAAQ